MSAAIERPHRHAISAREYLRMGEAAVFSPEVRLELIQGEIIEMAPIGSAHAAVVNALAAFFSRNLGERAIVSVQNPLVLGEHSVPQPDLMLLRPQATNYFDAHPTAQDVLLLVEVSDATLRFDLESKLPVYARAATPEVWVADIGARMIHVFRDPEGGTYRTSCRAGRGERLAPIEFPGIDIEVATLFPAAAP